MTDPTNSLSYIAGLVLLVTILWAATLGFISWDTQRRKDAGQPVHAGLWMLLGILLPILGFLIYLAARRPPGLDGGQPKRRRQTRLKAPLDARDGQAVLSGELEEEVR